MIRPFAGLREMPDVATIKMSDRIALWGFTALVGVLVAVDVFAAIRRIVTLVAGPPVTVELAWKAPVAHDDIEAVSTRTDITLAYLDPGERFWLVTEQVADSLAWILLGSCIAVLLVSVALRIPFSRRTPRLLAIGSVVAVFLGGIAVQAHSSAAQTIAHRLDIEVAFDVGIVRLLILPIALLAIAYVIGSGTRIQRDTEGLV